MALDYTTKSGDTWDLIALNVYGSELKADWLMQNNPRYIHIVRFDSGTVLSTPALPAEKSGDLPPWKALQSMPKLPNGKMTGCRKRA